MVRCHTAYGGEVAAHVHVAADHQYCKDPSIWPYRESVVPVEVAHWRDGACWCVGARGRGWRTGVGCRRCGAHRLCKRELEPGAQRGSTTREARVEGAGVSL